MTKVCSTCGISLEKRSRTDYREVDERYYCKKCYRNLHRPEAHSSSGQDDFAAQQNELQPTVHLDIERSYSGHNKCVFGCSVVRSLRNLTKEECLEIFIKKNVFVKYGARVCTVHDLEESLVIPNDFETAGMGVSLNAEEILTSFHTFKSIILTERDKAPLSFLNMKNDMLKFETGLEHQQYFDVLQFLSSEDLLTRVRMEFALGVYLSRLRRGYTFEELAIRWNIAEKTARNYCQLCRSILIGPFCDKYLSLTRDRADLINHQTDTAKRLHAPSGEHIILVLDGTYVFIQKSSNFAFQRMTYSGHKHRNLIKPMMAVFPDGYIGAVWGPFPGNKNDASILIDLLNNTDWNSFQPGDVIIVDRGFRDCIPNISSKGFVAKMPSFADKPSLPLTTQQANSSRLITKVRYIVEVVNGRIKKIFKYFDRTIQNTTLDTLFNDFKIACALLNLTFKPVVTSDLDKRIIDRMLHFSNEKNHLFELVCQEKLNSQTSRFQRMEDVEIEFFPRLDMQDLWLYTCGSYAIKMAHSYYADHLNSNGDFEFEMAKPTRSIDFRKYGIALDWSASIFLKVRIRSRHSMSVKYFVYVLVDKNKQGIEALSAHFCSCKVGQRVVGCCSHVATIMWFFGYARFLLDINKPAYSLCDIFYNIASSESEENDEDDV